MTRLLFDFPAPDGRPGRTVFRDPVRVVTAAGVEEVIPGLREVEDGLASGLHAAGYLAYEAAPAFEPRMRVRTGNRMPLLWFGLFQGPDISETVRQTDGLGEGADDEAAWTLDASPACHAAAVAAIHEAIAEGRTYQVNHTARFRAPFRDDPLALYERLRRAQGDGWHAYLDLGRFAIASASPELFFRVEGREITTRPMKGTRPRGRWIAEDRILEAELGSSAKDRAENLMIVDLLRNDLGRVADTGTICVPSLLELERYPTVWQMTSTITARLRDDVSLLDLFRALFPCGSVTGAPKISTMELIAGLEGSPREVYCGAIGWIRPDGDCAFNVPIRTIWIDREARRLNPAIEPGAADAEQIGEAVYGVGGGVVWDSDPGDEYGELLAKAAVLRERWPRFDLVETLRLEDGRFTRLDRHLARLRDSADYFGFTAAGDPAEPGGAVMRALERLACSRPAGTHRSRLTLSRDGRVHVAAEPLDWSGGQGPDDPASTPPAGPARITLAAEPIDSGDRFLFHKTTNREPYRRRLLAAPPGSFDVLLRNERDELTELTRGNLVVELDGRLVTPARDAGLLAGCLREELLADGIVVEERLCAADLSRASRLWFINSVRGWVAVRHAPCTT